MTPRERAGGRGGGDHRLHPGRRACSKQWLAALTCRCAQAPRGSSTCLPTPGAGAADPGSCPAVPLPLLPGSEAAAPSGTLPASSSRRSPLPALRPAPRSSAAAAGPLPGRGHQRAGVFAPPAQGTGLQALGGAGVQARSWGAECKLLRCAGDRGARRAWLARGSWGPGRLAWAGHAELPDLLGSALGCALPLASSWARRGGQGAQSTRPLAFYTKVSRPEEEEEPLLPGAEGRGWPRG